MELWFIVVDQTFPLLFSSCPSLFTLPLLPFSLLSLSLPPFSYVAIGFFSWYHGKISRDQAEDILRNQPDFSFLVRNSESCRMDYSLSIRSVITILYYQYPYEEADFITNIYCIPLLSRNSLP